MKWPVVPLCEAQLQDVNPADILNNGLYRKCNTYKGGGGYDKFPEIYNRRFGTNHSSLNNQFVVQVHGCPFRCPYCYVTQEGVFGKPVNISSKQLVEDFIASGCSVFHLMGGAPALYLDRWPDLLSKLGGAVFHSDFLCIEREFDKSLLKEIAQYKNSLYAISIKGANNAEIRANTGVNIDESLFERNLNALFECGINCYVTFTGMSEQSIEEFKNKHSHIPFDDSFGIALVHYNALDYRGKKEKA